MRPKAARTDIVRADKPQPIQPLFIGQFDAITQRRPRAGYSSSIAQARAAYNLIL